ncbi:MarR family winged helix-turn-helix transcriptional regulator [Lentzea guizhouensis]|uniref:MarR family winged helix-turn-helix transcriptional regulator n=1 Tax=Lentzea guizhouensis TaxID=1586287 RepID=UPI0014732138|nr:MarR family winged helix-turn-helix transcriptional regulator [Lentzea guizhouensis]
MDAALVRLRRLWSAPRSSIKDDGIPVDMSSILVVEACARAAEAGQDSTIRDIAAFTDTEHSTASRLVDKAAKVGLVQREPSSSDARRTRVVLTDSGRRTRERATDFRLTWLTRVLRHWPTGDVEHLAELLTRFADEVDLQGPPGREPERPDA